MDIYDQIMDTQIMDTIMKLYIQNWIMDLHNKHGYPWLKGLVIFWRSIDKAWLPSQVKN